jgi:transposase
MDDSSKKVPKNVYSSKFKFDRVIEAIKKGDNSVVAREYNLTAGMVSKWKGQLLTHGYRIFDNHPDKEVINLKKKVEKLEQIIGKKEVELNLIKNFTDFYQSPNT